MAAVMHGVRYLRQGIGVPNFLRGPASHPRQRILSAFASRVISHLFTPVAPSVEAVVIRPTQLSNAQNIGSRLSLPVKHALSRPFSAPRLPKPPAVPANVTHVGLGTARAFHSGRPIFQSMVDNVPIATRALWEAEWDLKMKNKEARRIRRTVENKTITKSQEMLKPKPIPVVARPQCDPSELDVYFPVQPVPAVTTHLLVPLAPTPTARLPLSTRNDGDGAHPLLPIAELASVHTNHRLHSLRVSTLFSRLDTANVWDDPGVNVDAYAFGPRHDPHHVQGKQCTILRVTFKGWNAVRVRSILGHSAEEWYTLEETNLDGQPTLAPLPELTQDVHTSSHSDSLSFGSVEINPTSSSGPEMDALSSPPMRASASAQHDLVFPTLDFSSAFTDAVDNVPPPSQPVMLLRTVSELIRDAELASQSSASLMNSGSSWECLGLDSSP